MPTRVVIPQRLCAPKTFQKRVRSEHHVLDLLDTAVLATRDGSDVLHDLLRSFGFTRTGLA